MQTLGSQAALAFNAEADIKEWANGVALNPARVPPERPLDPALAAALERLRAIASPGIAAMAKLAGLGTGAGAPCEQSRPGGNRLDPAAALSPP